MKNSRKKRIKPMKTKDNLFRLLVKKTIMKKEEIVIKPHKSITYQRALKTIQSKILKESFCNKTKWKISLKTK
jgi:hypothetical protein